MKRTGLGIILSIFLALIVLCGCSNQPYQTAGNNQNLVDQQCSSSYTISCFVNAGMKEIRITKENITCSSDDDCSLSNIQDSCSPGYPNVIKCAGEKYFCSNDGYCKRCDTCAQNMATEEAEPPKENPKYSCSIKSDCLATTDTCECVTSGFYIYNKNDSCENFGCDCISGKCTKTAPLGK